MIWSGVTRTADALRRSSIGAMVMPSTRTFSDVTAEILSRMKELGRAEYGIVYDSPEGPTGTATSRTPLGECVIEFAHDAAKAELTLTLVKKPWLLPEGLLWTGFAETLERCRKEV
jgi:hypothetical protein